MFEQEFAKFLAAQRRSAGGMRLEQLNKDLTGETKMLREVIWPVLKSFDDLTLEHELLSSTGVRIYVDVFYRPLGLAFESEGYVAHAENITRDRFAFERMRARTLVIYGYKYIPFSWDEIEKRPEVCRRSVYELLGRYSSTTGISYTELTVNEREVIRCAFRLQRPFRLEDVCSCLRLGSDASRRVLRKLLEKQLIKPIGSGVQRHHAYVLGEKAADYML